MKKILSVLLIIVILMSTFVIYINAEDSQFQSLFNNNGILTKISALDSNGNPLKNGSVDVYSYLENKNVLHMQLDENGEAIIMYQPPIDLLVEKLKKDSYVDTHYLFFIGNDEELSTQGFTKTYYAPEKSEKIEKSINIEKNKENLIIKTEKLSQMKNIKVVKKATTGESTSDPNRAPDPWYGTVISYSDMGSKKVKFAQISSTYGCTVSAALTQGNKTTISGDNIVTLSFTAGSSLTVSSGDILTPYPCFHEFYTYYNFREEYCSYGGGGYTYYFYRLRATGWNGGIDHGRKYNSKNDVSYDSIKTQTTCKYSPGSSVKLESGSSRTVGLAGEISSILTTSKYNLSVNYEVYSNTSLVRTHGSNNYYEYGTEPILTDRSIVVE